MKRFRKIKHLNPGLSILGTVGFILSPYLVNWFTQPSDPLLTQPSATNVPAHSQAIPVTSQPTLVNPKTIFDGAMGSGTVALSFPPYPVALQLGAPNTATGDRFQQVMQTTIAQHLYQHSMGEIMQTVAQQLLGTAYKADSLDQTNHETLVISLEHFDCVTFVETVLALSQSIALQDYSYSTFANHLRNQRYRDGTLNGYCSRLHYFSEWIANNQQRGNVVDLSADLGGIDLGKPLNFMSQHRSSYPLMVDHEANYQCILSMEARLADMAVTYIPSERISDITNQLQPGDIVAIATDLEGLDVTHTGLVYQNPDGSFGLIHASPIGSVTIARDLAHYVNAVEHQIGILVARPIDPRSHRSSR